MSNPRLNVKTGIVAAFALVALVVNVSGGEPSLYTTDKPLAAVGAYYINTSQINYAVLEGDGLSVVSGAGNADRPRLAGDECVRIKAWLDAQASVPATKPMLNKGSSKSPGDEFLFLARLEQEGSLGRPGAFNPLNKAITPRKPLKPLLKVGRYYINVTRMNYAITEKDDLILNFGTQPTNRLSLTGTDCQSMTQWLDTHLSVLSREVESRSLGFPGAYIAGTSIPADSPLFKISDYYINISLLSYVEDEKGILVLNFGAGANDRMTLIGKDAQGERRRLANHSSVLRLPAVKELRFDDPHD
jgi:hypothetical protein